MGVTHSTVAVSLTGVARYREEREKTRIYEGGGQQKDFLGHHDPDRTGDGGEIRASTGGEKVSQPLPDTRNDTNKNLKKRGGRQQSCVRRQTAREHLARCRVLLLACKAV